MRTLLSLAIAFLVLLTTALAGMIANVLISKQFEKYVIRLNEVRIADIVGGLDAQYDPEVGWNATLVHATGMYALYNGYIVKVYDASGASVWDAEYHDMSLCGAIMAEISDRMSHWRMNDGGALMSETHDLISGGQTVGSAVIRYYGPYFLTEEDFAFLSTLNKALVIASAVSLLFALAAGALLAARTARPIVKTAGIAARIAKGDYAVRYEGDAGSRETQELVTSVNLLAKALGDQEALRKRLTGDVAHELRTPLAAVGAHLEAMIDGVWLPTPQRLESCREEIVRLSKLVADLEALSDAESADARLELSDVDLGELARAVGRAHEAELMAKRLSYAVEGGATARGDEARLTQVLSNLVTNAVKYTPEGGHIRVTARAEGHEAVLTVADDGVGIPKHALPLIFERFYRVDLSRSRQTGGAGIGLAIVNSLVRAHGGTVEVTSEPNKGSSFTVRLPEAEKERG